MYEFKFADIGEGIHEGTILKWLVKVGEKVQDGKPLVVVETDKVNADLPSPVAGTIHKLGFKEGDNVHVGDVLVYIAEDGEKVETKAAPVAMAVSEGKEDNPAGVVGTIEVSDEVISASNEMTETSVVASNAKALASPVARKMAVDLGLDISKIKGSGDNGRVMKEDILKASERKQPAVSVAVTASKVTLPSFAADTVTRVRISKLRKTIVQAMTTSHSVVAPTTLMDEFDVSQLVAMREAQKENAKASGIKLTYLSYIAKAITLALRDYPLLNSSFDHDNDEIVFKNYINLGIAVDTPDGLIVPNIKDADTKSILELAQEIDKLASQARERTVKLETLQNGTFTITNYGAIGTKFGTPVIKYPEVAIIGIGSIYKKPIVNEQGAIVVADVLPVSLTIDHRVIDGADGGRFLLKLKQHLSNPAGMLLHLK